MPSYVSSPSVTMQIINKYKINLKRRWGQNFLIDTNIAKKIARYANLRKDDILLEVGSGIGGLTQILLPKVKKVVCVELDNLLVEVFKDIFCEQIGKKIELIHNDALKIDYLELGALYNINKMVSNLPYNIASPLILKILLESESINSLVVTIQKDIADRLISPPGSKDYNAYTVKANFLADFNVLFLISRNCFVPRPNVDSAVVKITKKDYRHLVKGLLEELEKELEGLEETKEIEKAGDIESIGNIRKVIIDFFKFVDICFLHRRKKLVNTLIRSSSEYKEKEKLILELLSCMGKDKNVRAEELSLANYIFLYKNLQKLLNFVG